MVAHFWHTFSCTRYGVIVLLFFFSMPGALSFELFAVNMFSCRSGNVLHPLTHQSRPQIKTSIDIRKCPLFSNFIIKMNTFTWSGWCIEWERKRFATNWAQISSWLIQFTWINTRSQYIRFRFGKNNTIIEMLTSVKGKKNNEWCKNHSKGMTKAEYLQMIHNWNQFNIYRSCIRYENTLTSRQINAKITGSHFFSSPLHLHPFQFRSMGEKKIRANKTKTCDWRLE